MILSGLKPIGFADLLDIAFVTVLVYSLLIWFKKTKTAFVAMGLAMFAVVYGLARWAGMYMTVWIFQGFFAVLVIAIIIIFQEELRHILERIAVWSLQGGRMSQRPTERQVEILLRTAANFSRDRVGALIVLHGRDPLDRHVEGGWDLNGVLSEPLLESIFDSHSLGHDGAVLIAEGKVTKFGCHLPLSKEFRKLSSLGMRHTAALGLAERCDALSLVVSEEKGSISVAQDGDLVMINNLQELQEMIELFYIDKMPKLPENSLNFFLKHNPREKMIAFMVSLLIWFLFIGLGSP